MRGWPCRCIALPFSGPPLRCSDNLRQVDRYPHIDASCLWWLNIRPVQQILCCLLLHEITLAVQGELKHLGLHGRSNGNIRCTDPFTKYGYDMRIAEPSARRHMRAAHRHTRCNRARRPVPLRVEISRNEGTLLGRQPIRTTRAQLNRRHALPGILLIRVVVITRLEDIALDGHQLGRSAGFIPCIAGTPGPLRRVIPCTSIIAPLRGSGGCRKDAVNSLCIPLILLHNRHSHQYVDAVHTLTETPRMAEPLPLTQGASASRPGAISLRSTEPASGLVPAGNAPLRVLGPLIRWHP